jgi:ABC-2 type transport system permease protein
VNDARLAIRQVWYENLAFWRNPASAFFTFAFPLMFLVIFTAIIGSDDTNTLPSGREVTTATYYTASILAFSVITACYTNVAITVSFARDEGLLKRIRGTPLPGWAYLLGRMIHSTLLMALLVVIVCVFGWAFYDVDLPVETLPAFIVTLVVGAAAFCALGLACTIIIPNADAAPAVVNATVLPLLFISGVFIPLDDAPDWLLTIADIFPVRHFLIALFDSFLPSAKDASGWAPVDLLIVAAWGAAALLVAARHFIWEPRR